jgi:hypothetical protein
MLYICQHCLAVLGEYVDGGEQPRCPDHLDGVVTLVEQDDGDK